MAQSNGVRATSWWVLARPVVAVIALVIVVAVAILIAIKALPWTTNWDIWTVFTAVGTVGATLVAVMLAWRGLRRDRDATARVVAAWVTDEYEPRADGSSYNRIVKVHIANEGDEPVFDATVSLLVGSFKTPLGPLSVPPVVSVIPPRRELVYDISVPLLAHGGAWNPLVELWFADPKCRRWHRDSIGALSEVTGQKTRWSEPVVELDEAQLGDQSLLNPMTIALAFLAGLQDEGTSADNFKVLIAPEAVGWDAVDWIQVRTELARYQPTSMVSYPAPRIARIKLSGDQSLEGRVALGERMQLSDYKFLTLTMSPQRGWRVFSVGDAVPPEAIYFGGSLLQDVGPAIPAQEDERD